MLNSRGAAYSMLYTRVATCSAVCLAPPVTGLHCTRRAALDELQLNIMISTVKRLMKIKTILYMDYIAAVTLKEKCSN